MIHVTEVIEKKLRQGSFPIFWHFWYQNYCKHLFNTNFEEYSNSEKQKEDVNCNDNKTTRIESKPWMFRLHFTVYGVVLAFKKWVTLKKDSFFEFSKLFPYHAI